MTWAITPRQAISGLTLRNSVIEGCENWNLEGLWIESPWLGSYVSDWAACAWHFEIWELIGICFSGCASCDTGDIEDSNVNDCTSEFVTTLTEGIVFWICCFVTRSHWPGRGWVIHSWILISHCWLGMELGSAPSVGFLISDCDLDADDAELDSFVGTVDTSKGAVGGMLSLCFPTVTKRYSNLWRSFIIRERTWL